MNLKKKKKKTNPTTKTTTIQGSQDLLFVSLGLRNGEERRVPYVRVVCKNPSPKRDKEIEHWEYKIG